jgi:carbon-monoxide dehydrogenase medium subunit
VKNFEFHQPRSVADALTLLRGHRGGDAAKLLAGGQSLLPVMKLDLAQPEALISLAKVPGLSDIRSDGDNLVIGARVTHVEVASSPEVKRRIPGLAALASGIGDAQIRNRGTLGGSLAHADPAADYPAAVLALGATIETDRRKIAADDFFTGLFQSALEPDEIITAVHFPVPECAAYAKFPHPASKYAVVGVMVAKAATSGGGGAGAVRVAVTGAGSKVFRLTKVEAALAANFSPDAVGASVVDPSELRSGGEASPEYLAHLVSVMAKRAVQACR